MKKDKIDYYTLDAIRKVDAQWNVIFGQRSNGKTYAVLTMGLDNYANDGKQMAIVRRYLDDIMPSKISTIFAGIVKNGYIRDLYKNTPEKWTDVVYSKRKFYLARWDKGKDDEKKLVTDKNPFAYVFAVTEEEDYKQNSYPDITTIFFDEFLSRTGYLSDEFVIFCNIVSTIKRLRTDVTIWLVGNTINQYCPYFTEMGIKHAYDIPIGKIEVYTYGESKLKVAVQRAENIKKGGKAIVDDYFAFDNPKLKMITSGEWELDIYPHAPCKWLPKEIRYTYFIKFDDNLYQCEVIKHEHNWFTFIHRKTTPIRDPTKDLIFQQDVALGRNIRSRITEPTDELGKKLLSFFVCDKVFYQDNEVGDAIANYLDWCGKVH